MSASAPMVQYRGSKMGRAAIKKAVKRKPKKVKKRRR